MEGAGLPVATYDVGAFARFERRAGERCGLTPRQAAVLFHVCQGVTYHADLAAEAGMGVQTLKNHLTAIFKRLGVANMTGALVKVWPLFDRAHRRDRGDARRVEAA